MFAALRAVSHKIRFWTPRSSGPIGLELAGDTLHLVQMERCDGKGLRLRAARSLAYSLPREQLLRRPKEIKDLVRAALHNRPFDGQDVVTCMPADQIKLLSFNYRLTPGQTDADAIVKSTRERLGEDWNDSIIDYIPIRMGDFERGERSALVAVAARQGVVDYLELLRSAGLQVNALEIGPLAIKRLISSMGDEKSDDLVLAINFGRHKSYLTAVSHKRLLLDRELNFGERQIADRLTQQIGLDDDTALSMLSQFGFVQERLAVVNGTSVPISSEFVDTLQEILKPTFRALDEELGKVALYLASETHGDTPKRLYLLGSIARWPGADSFLNRVLRMPVEVLNPFSAFAARTDPAVLRSIDPTAGIALATGMALRGMDAHG